MRTKSLRGAADQLNLSHPTARRRLGALEAQLGLQLFERRRDGLHPTLHAGDLQHAAERVEQALQALRRVTRAADPALRGPIRVSVPDVVATDLLMDDFVAFAERWPQIDLRIEPSHKHSRTGSEAITRRRGHARPATRRGVRPCRHGRRRPRRERPSQQTSADAALAFVPPPSRRCGIRMVMGPQRKQTSREASANAKGARLHQARQGDHRGRPKRGRPEHEPASSDGRGCREEGVHDRGDAEARHQEGPWPHCKSVPCTVHLGR